MEVPLQVLNMSTYKNLASSQKEVQNNQPGDRMGFEELLF
jgi:hypothetical protein